jgi:cellulose biosynthesis protein BcsQ
MGEIITFYSYKGGTGRTMALANVGHILAWQLTPPRKVLMIDWDLEAPGLHKFFFEQLKFNFSYLDTDIYPETIDGAPGLIDFLGNIKTFYEGKYPNAALGVMHAETADARTAFMDALSLHPLTKYTLTVTPPSGVPSADATVGLFLMKAGNQASPHYINLVRTFAWETFYEQYGSFLTHFREYLIAEYDVVLIDSRTGLTDIGDICTRVMPEKLVGVFVPNEQNVEGLMRVMRRAAEHRLASRDPRGLVLFPLASRIDTTRSRHWNAWWKGGVLANHKVVGYEPRFEEFVKTIYRLESCDLDSFFDSTQLPHDADYAFGEEVAARDKVSGRQAITSSYANLARYLVEDLLPWETLPSEPQQASAPMGLDAAETPRQQKRYLWPILVAFAGLMIVLLGPILQTEIFDSDSKDLPKIGNDLKDLPKSGAAAGTASSTDVGHIAGTISSTDIAGFGIGKATLALNWYSSHAGVHELMLLKLSRGTVTPTELLLSTVGPTTAVVTSEGLGLADLNLELINLTPKTNASGTVAFTYRWPVALTATAVGGALIGVAIRGMLIVKSGFRSPVLGARLFINAVAILTGMTIVLVYSSAVSPLIAPAFRYHWALIMLLALTGPLVLHWALRKIPGLVSAVSVSK